MLLRIHKDLATVYYANDKCSNHTPDNEYLLFQELILQCCPARILRLITNIIYCLHC